MSISYDYISGIGFDVHAWQPSNTICNLPLCGILVPCYYQVIAHSDGDVALHALVDAVLGGIGAGDIGEHFPPTDHQWKNKDSSFFLKKALEQCQKKQVILIHADITIICEEPRITTFKPMMREKLSHLLSLPLQRINIKGTTTEKLGFLGRQEGIAAQAIVSLKIPA